MTAKEILLRWIETALSRAEGAVAFQTHHIHDNVRSWGKRVYGKTYSATNYERRFRELRGKDSDKLTRRGIANIAKRMNGSEATWIATSLPDATLTNHDPRDNPRKTAASASGS